MESKGVTKRKSGKAAADSKTAIASGKEGVTKKPKRNTEKRRERSKVAARCRRGKESEIFTELSNSLPVTESSRSNLDKASVMRLTLCDLKIKQMLENVDDFTKHAGEPCPDKNLFDGLINNAVSGFVLVCSCDGDVIYVSEGIASCLGLSQYEVMGQNILEFSHPCDQSDVSDMLESSSKASFVEGRSALFRMKSANNSRGRNAHHRSANYKVVNCTRRIFSADMKVLVGDGEAERVEETQMKKWFVGICEPLLHPSDVDIPLNKQTFLSKHSPDLKFEYVDEGITKFMGYSKEDMIGKSLFDFYHACDGDGITRSFKSLYTKGQTCTERSRFLAKGGGWIWVVSQATTINNNAGKPTSVVCIHFVTSGVECDGEIVSHVQLLSANSPIIPVGKPEVVPVPAVLEKKQPLQETTNLQQTITIIPWDSQEQEQNPSEPTLIVNPFTGPILSKPTPSTSKIFAPRTEDMDTGFLMPVNDTLIVTKEEPEDLTHLAPIAGDECVPLSNVPLLDDLLQWLDAADMEYTVLEGYEEPFPLPLISAVTGSPIPIPLGMTTTAELCSAVGKDEAMLDQSMSQPTQCCGSPLLLQSTDPTLLSSCDPLLLSPYKTPSPEPFQSAPVASPTCADLMSPDLFSTHYYSDPHHHGGGGGGTAGSSSHKSKAGGGYEDEPYGFPMVSDFQEVLFSPAGGLDSVGPPTSPCSPSVTVNLMDRGGGSLLPSKMEKGGGSGPTLNSSLGFGLMSKEPPANFNQVKCLTRETTEPNSEEGGPPPNDLAGMRPLPSKVYKSSYTDEAGNNKPWLQIPAVTPSRPPWDVGGQQAPQLLAQSHLGGIIASGKPQPASSITIGTQTLDPIQAAAAAASRQQQLQDQHRQRQLQKYRQLLMNPAIVQAILLNRRLRPANGGAAAAGSRKRNFVGELLANGGLLAHSLGESCGVSSVGASPLLELPKNLVQLTNIDCEVNAPLESKPLLDGPDLLTALDT